VVCADCDFGGCGQRLLTPHPSIHPFMYSYPSIQVGEAPDEIRNVCRQRSRWTKGHMQVGGWMDGWVGDD